MTTKQVVAELVLENRVLKKRGTGSDSEVGMCDPIKSRFGSSAGPVADTEPFQTFLAEYEAERERLARLY